MDRKVTLKEQIQEIMLWSSMDNWMSPWAMESKTGQDLGTASFIHSVLKSSQFWPSPSPLPCLLHFPLLSSFLERAFKYFLHFPKFPDLNLVIFEDIEQIKLSAFWLNIDSFLCTLYDIFPAGLHASSPCETGGAHILKISSASLTAYLCCIYYCWAYCFICVSHYSLWFLLLRNGCSNQAV